MVEGCGLQAEGCLNVHRIDFPSEVPKSKIKQVSLSYRDPRDLGMRDQGGGQGGV